MGLADIEKKIKEFEDKGWVIEDLRSRGEYHESSYHLISPAGDVFDSYYLQHNMCPICMDYEERNLKYEEDHEETEEERWCDGSLHDPEYIKALEAAEALYELIHKRDTIEICRLIEGK